MPTLRWLFRPVNIIVFIVLLLLFANRHALFSTQEGESEQVKQLLSRVDGVVERMDGVTDDKLQEQRPAVSAPSDTPSAGETLADVPQMMVQSDSDVEEPPPFSELPAQEEPSSRLSLQVMGLQQEGDAAPAEESSAPEQAPVAAEPLQNEDPQVLLGMSRQAAWVGDFEGAAEHYRALLRLQPENYDAHGELGNVLLQMGDRTGAVEAYSEAARLLLGAGYPQAAWQVMMLVSQLDPRKGYALDQRLRKAYAAMAPTQ